MHFLYDCLIFRILYWHQKWKAQHHILFTLFQKPERQTSIEEKRKYVVAEILETEKSYVDALKMIQEASYILFLSQLHRCQNWTAV